MKLCSYCGKENLDLVTACAGCGTGELRSVDMSEPAPSETNIESQASSDKAPLLRGASRWFRWRPAAIVLIVLALIYWGIGLLNIWLGRSHSQRGDQSMAHFMYWAAFWNVLIASLCFAGFQMMRHQSNISVLAGAVTLVFALFIVMRTWLGGLSSGRNPFPVAEALLTWLPLTYVIIYGFKEHKRRKVND